MTNQGHLVFHDKLVPATSMLSFRPGLTRANRALLTLSARGGFKVRCVMPSGSAAVILDVTGDFE